MVANSSYDLVILAAGIGRRFGGLKQVQPVGPAGELIIEYSAFDALCAGFGRLVLVIRWDMEADFRATIGRRLEPHMDVQYVFQEMEGQQGNTRTKPWGTGHAVLVAREAVRGPFAVINADDFYGPSGYAALAGQFATVRALVQEKRFDALDAQLKDGLYGIDRIAELVANLKDFSRLDRGKVAQVDLHQGIESTLRIAQHLIGKRAVKKSFGDIPPVTCSPSQINQVLLNLVANAAQATPEAGGQIGIRTAMRDAGHVAIDVADNGHGIPQEVLPRIFDPFFTTKEVGKGTGLGLAISFKIVEDHGGKLEVQSKPGNTRFTIVLPVSAPDGAHR